MLGTPLPKENQVNFETEENFEFSFDIALAPEFNVELSANDSVDYYDINVTDEMVDQQVKMYTQRTAKYEKVEDYQDNDMLKGLLAELDEKRKYQRRWCSGRRRCNDAGLHEERRTESYLQRCQDKYRTGIQSFCSIRQQ